MILYTPPCGSGSASDTAESSVRVHDVILPSLSVVLCPSGLNDPSRVRMRREVATFDAGRPFVVSRIWHVIPSLDDVYEAVNSINLAIT